MSEAPKPYSAELRAVRDEFNQVAQSAKEAAAKLDTLIWKAEAVELRAKNDKVLDQFVDRRHELLQGHDVTFFIAKTQAMGEGFNSPVGAAINTAQQLTLAIDSSHGAGIGAALYDTGTKWLRLTDFDRLDKAREKTANETHDLQPIAKEILVNNTPDKANDRQKHYVIISDGKATDNIDVTAQMLTAALALNPRITVDFINVGEKAGEGNIKDLAAKINAPVHNVATHEGLHGAMMAVLTARFAKVEAPKVVEAPKPEATPVAAPAAVVEPPKQAPKP